MSANLTPDLGLELRLDVVLGGLLFNREGRERRSPKWSVEILPGMRGRDIVQYERMVPVGALASIEQVTFCTDKQLAGAGYLCEAACRSCISWLDKRMCFERRRAERREGKGQGVV
jgi:hypothetical protein